MPAPRSSPPLPPREAIGLWRPTRPSEASVPDFPAFVLCSYLAPGVLDAVAVQYDVPQGAPASAGADGRGSDSDTDSDAPPAPRAWTLATYKRIMHPRYPSLNFLTQARPRNHRAQPPRPLAWLGRIAPQLHATLACSGGMLAKVHVMTSRRRHELLPTVRPFWHRLTQLIVAIRLRQKSAESGSCHGSPHRPRSVI